MSERRGWRTTDNRPDHPCPMRTRDDPAGRGPTARDASDARPRCGHARLADLARGCQPAGGRPSRRHLARCSSARLEREELERLPFGDLAAIASTLGLDLRIGAWPAGDPLRDHVQLRLLEALRGRLHASLTWRTEVPLPISGDRRAWDAIVGTPDGLVGIEGISRIGAADATIRRANLKLADDPRISRAVLVVTDTARNWAALRAALATVRADYPLQTREVMAALSVGEAPRLNGDRRPAAAATRASSTGCPHRGKVVDARGAARPKFVDKPVGGPAPGP